MMNARTNHLHTPIVIIFGTISFLVKVLFQQIKYIQRDCKSILHTNRMHAIISKCKQIIIAMHGLYKPLLLLCELEQTQRNWDHSVSIPLPSFCLYHIVEKIDFFTFQEGDLLILLHSIVLYQMLIEFKQSMCIEYRALFVLPITRKYSQI